MIIDRAFYRETLRASAAIILVLLAVAMFQHLTDLLTRAGLGGTNHFESGGFIRSEAGVRHPDLQYHFLPMAVRYDGNAPATGHGFQAHVGPMRPTSRGHVRVRSARPTDAPEIVIDNALEGDSLEDVQGIPAPTDGGAGSGGTAGSSSKTSW